MNATLSCPLQSFMELDGLHPRLHLAYSVDNSCKVGEDMDMYCNTAMLYVHESYGELQNQSWYHTD